MKSLRNIFVVMVTAVLLGIPSVSSPQRIIYTLCQWYNVEKNCYRCSDYFSVRSEDEAQRKCKGGKPYYFPSVFALQTWMIANCTCDHDRD